jgi:pilus assembly protein CpaC
MRPLFDRTTTGVALRAVAAIAPVLVSQALIGPARAQSAGSPVVNVRVNDEAIARKLDLSIGKSIIIELPRDAAEVFVANPKIANAVVRSTRKVFIIGIADGYTSVFVMDKDSRQIAALEITVGRDLNVLRQTLRNALPKYNLDIKPAGDSILLTGEVGSAADAQQAVDIANAFVGVSGNLFSSSKGAVINGLTIRGKDQVMLKVTVAEVARSVIKQLGVNTSGTWQSFNFVTDTPFTLNAQNLSNTALNLAGSRGGFQTSATLRAFERAGVSRTLAEPSLTAISGETAKFTAGGEVPVPKSQDCTTDTFGRRSCTIGVEFKPFGVTLNFTPVVLSENRISLRVSTDVTEFDFENQVRFDTINVPATKVRKSETTVELPSGGTMMTAGILQQASRQNINGLPGLLNLPVLGALFRSRDYVRQETELMILVTPYIAKPLNAGEVSKPDDGFVEASDPQTVLLGRLNRLYGVAGAPPTGRVYKGRVGFITKD